MTIFGGLIAVSLLSALLAVCLLLWPEPEDLGTVTPATRRRLR